MCRDVDFEFFGTAVTKCFSHTPLTGNATSRFGQCYDGANAAATAAWPPPTPFGATAAELVNVAESPKGIFCKCSQTFMRLMRPYISYIKWAGIAVMLVFAAVLFACVILWKVKGANQSKHTRGGSIAEDEAKWSKNGGVEFHNVNSLAQP